MIVRPSCVEDLPAVALLVRASFAASLRPYMIYTQHGIAAFLGAMLDQPALFPERTLLTCEDNEGGVIGFAEFRVNERTTFLSYVCVAPHARRRGVATAMIASFLRDHPELATLELDVFEDNQSAVTLYRKMGFSGSTRILWFVRALPRPVDAPVLPINPALALAAFERYGFCEMPVLWRGVEHRLGRTGASVLRCFSAADYADESLLAAMRHLIPELEETLLIQPADQTTPAVGRQVNAALRLTLELAERVLEGMQA